MGIERIFDIKGFYGGEADDSVNGPDNSFYSGENIDVIKDMSGIKLSPKLEDTGYAFDSKIIYMVHSSELGGLDVGLITCLQNGKIYLNGDLKETLNTGTDEWNRITGIGINWISGVQYYYFITQSSSGQAKIHRASASLSSWDISYKSITGLQVGDLRRSYTISFGGLLYIALKNKVVVLGDTETVTTYLTLPGAEYIMGITEFQNYFRIYANKQNIGVQYRWDGAEGSAPDYRQEWINQPILSVVNDGAFDYILLGFNDEYSDLYLVTGTQKQELRVNLEKNANARRLGGTSSIDSTQYLSIREGIIYISGKTKESDNYGIYTYGNYYPGASNALVFSYVGTTKPFYWHTHSINQTFMADNDTSAPKVYTISHENPPANYNDGYVVSLLYKGISWENKTLLKIKIGYNLETGSSLKVYGRTSLLGDWTLIKEITDDTSKRILITGNEIEQADFGTFNEIQFKIELLAGGVSNTTTPTVSRFTAFMPIMDND